MRRLTKVVDTNVILIANEQHPEVSPKCVADCVAELQSIMRKGRVAIDDGFRILNEYQANIPRKGGKGPGDAFVKWVLRNNTNPGICDQVQIQEHSERGFTSFPEDYELEAFDRSDRKFVAVTRSHPMHPPIIQGSDSKWLDWAPALKRHGVEVVFLCEEDIQKFHKKKFGGN